MRIAFLLPNYAGKVVGSLLVYYRFAEQLAAAGHQVDVFHPALPHGPSSFREHLRGALWAIWKNWSRHPIPWIELPKGVRPRFRTRLEGLVSCHDRVVAFSWKAVAALDQVRTTGRVFGYVVEYETWAEADPATKALMEAAYRRPMPFLCSSRAVEDMLLRVGARDVRLCLHGIDAPRIGRPSPPGSVVRIGFPIRMEPVKSPEVLEECLRLLKGRFGERVNLWGFGNHDVPDQFLRLLDEYSSHPSNQELSALYAGSDIFAVPSRKEGFGMPAAEAMIHGCAVVSTDNGGIRTFGEHDRNCLIVPSDSGEVLATAVASLVEDPARRAALSAAAPNSVDFLRWEEAGRRLREAIGA